MKEIDVIIMKLRKDKTYIMGILNVTPDSFSDGGKFFSLEKALLQAEKLIEAGADIIDIGGESTRPGAVVIDSETEAKRVIPVIKEIRKKHDILISIDTYKSDVAEEAILAGADIVNDVSGGYFDDDMFEVVKKYDSYIVLMHNKSNKDEMPHAKCKNETKPYIDATKEVLKELNDTLNRALSSGLKEEKIIIDPGIGFAKGTSDNLKLLKSLKQLSNLGCLTLLGASKKRFIKEILGAENVFIGTLAVNTLAILEGIDIVRCHDVLETKQVLTMLEAIEKV